MVTAKKIAMGDRLKYYIRNYPTVLVVEVDNVGSRQFAEIRLALREKAHVYKGKNTMTRSILRQMIEEDGETPQYMKLLELVGSNMTMIFCISPLAEVRKIVLDNRVPAIAKAGNIAQLDVHIEAGPTPLEPSATAFFGALGIGTKILKGKIEILSNVHLLKVGERVGKSEATLLQKLNIKPFSYGFVTTWVCDNAQVYPAKVLEITDDIILAKISQGIANVASLSRQVSFPTVASVPHSVVEAFKKCAAVCLKGDFVFEEMKKMKEMCA